MCVFAANAQLTRHPHDEKNHHLPRIDQSILIKLTLPKIAIDIVTSTSFSSAKSPQNSIANTSLQLFNLQLLLLQLRRQPFDFLKRPRMFRACLL